MRDTATQAFDRLHIPSQNRALLCLDGGGIRGILTIQLLKALEERAGAPCHQIFDMVAGTSTGGIIAGLVASGHSAVEIEQLYGSFVTKVFTKRNLFSHVFLDPPAFTKASYRRILREKIGDATLEQTCRKVGIDMMITAHDVAEGEQTFFSFLQERPAERNVYSKVLLRAVMEATASAPTYFTPMERFVDGGLTTYNNPSLAAIMEAVQYGPGTYSIDKLTVFSFGTGCTSQFIKPEQVPNPPGPDAPFWLGWLMNETGNDAADQQSDLLRANRILPGFDYRRFQISLDRIALAKIPDMPLDHIAETDANKLSELTDKELSDIHLDAVPYFPVMKAIGEAFVEYLRRHAQQVQKPMFSYDLIDAHGKELLVTRTGDIERITRQLGDPEWIEGLTP
jgi:predicted acylesterase/phospholipase RssA